MPDWITTETPVTEAEELLARDLAGAEQTIEHLQESLADMALMLEDRGWQRLGMWGDQQFSRDGLRNAARLTRTMAVVNPLIRRGLNLRIAYVWGGGVSIQARATGEEDGEQDVNTVVQDFLDDKTNRKVLTGAKARETNERTLGTDGNLFFALPTNPRTGRVQVRTVPYAEVGEPIRNPEDATEVWFYPRTYITPAGTEKTTYYPDIDFRPRGTRVIRFRDSTRGEQTITAGAIAWDSPVIHLKVNDLDGWEFGIGDAFAAIAWARAYKEFLEDWARLVKSLSRFAWRLTADKKSKAQDAASKARTAMSRGNGTTVAEMAEPEPVAGLVSMGPGQALEAIPKSGATIDSESGKPLAAMVASALDVPVTMLLADPGQTGARAVAETLDKPTELMAGLRREMWADFYRQLLGYVIDSAVRAPQGPLTGTTERDEWGREVVDLGEGTERTVEVEWPDLSETPVETLVTAIETADATRKLPPLLIVKLLMAALRVKDADEWLEQVTDPETGEFRDPWASAGQAAVDASRRGEDPAETLR